MPVYILNGVPDTAFNQDTLGIPMELHNRQIFHTIVEDYIVSVQRTFYHFITDEKNGTNIKYQCTKIAKSTDIAIPIQKDWQKLQVNNLCRNSFGALTCKYSNMPHLIANVRRNITKSATKSTQQTNSIIYRNLD